MIGFGVLNGMAVTLRNFIGSYFEKERLITVQYPEERSPLPENYRNFPFLVYDGDDAHGEKRIAAEIKKIIADPDPANSKDIFPDCDQLKLQSKIRSDGFMIGGAGPPGAQCNCICRRLLPLQF